MKLKEMARSAKCGVLGALVALAGGSAWAGDAPEEEVVATGEAEFWLGGEEVYVTTTQDCLLKMSVRAVLDAPSAISAAGTIDLREEVTPSNGTAVVKSLAAANTNGVEDVIGYAAEY